MLQKSSECNEYLIVADFWECNQNMAASGQVNSMWNPKSLLKLVKFSLSYK